MTTTMSVMMTMATMTPVAMAVAHRHPYRRLRDALAKNPVLLDTSTRDTAQVISESDQRLLGWMGTFSARGHCSSVRLHLPEVEFDQFALSGYLRRKELPANVSRALDVALMQLRGHAEQAGSTTVTPTIMNNLPPE